MNPQLQASLDKDIEPNLSDDIYRGHLNPYKRIDNLISQGKTAIIKAQYTHAAEIFTDLLPIVTNIQNNDYIGIVYTYLSLIQRLVENYDEGLFYAKEAHYHLSKSNKQKNKICGKVCLGSAYFISNNYKLARSILNKAIKEYEAEYHNKIHYMVYAYSDLASIEIDAGNYRKAAKLLHEGIKNNDNYYELAQINSYYKLGKLNAKLNNIAEAHKYFNIAISLADKKSDKTFLANIYTEKARHLQNKGDYKNSSLYYSKVDSLWNYKIDKQAGNDVQQVAFNYINRTILKQAEINKQKAEIENLLLEKKTNRLTTYIALLLFLVSVLAMIIAIIKKRKAQRVVMLEKQVSQSNELILKNYIKGQEEERNRLARDLHDGIGSQMAILKMQLNNIISGNYKANNNVPLLLCDEIYQGLRDVAFNLMPRPLVKEGIVSALQELTMKLKKSTGIDFHFNNFGLHFRPFSEIESALFRIAQEISANIVKHSSATEANIDICLDNNSLGLTISWDGKGFNPNLLENSNGYGWKNINTRLSRVKGSISVDSSEDQDFSTVLVEIPIKPSHYAQTG
ncbi:MAG: histidine kinase [Bacteroidales bacterium]